MTSRKARNTPGDQRPQAAADETEHRQQRQKDISRLMAEGEFAGRRKPRAHIKLSFGADIDQPDTGRQCRRNRGQHQRNHADQKLGKPVGIAEYIGECIGIGLERILAGRDQQHRKNRERDGGDKREGFGACRRASPQRGAAVRPHRTAPSCRP